jgi:broad specificity phosphatase PhoE
MMGRSRLLTLGLAALLGAAVLPAAAEPLIYLVRHGERLDLPNDPGLSPAGEARAQRLAAMLADSGLRAIYTTPYKRTMAHAAPTARRLGLTPVVLPARDTEALLARLRTHGSDEAVLVVGHSNTVPALLRGLGYEAEVTIAEDEFDWLFVLMPREPRGAVPALARLRY